MQDMTSNFKEFIVKNGVVSTAASITIGFASATFIKSFVADVIMPLVFIVIVGGLKHVNKETSRFFSQFLSSKELRFTNFASELVTWVLIIVAAFLVLDLVVRKTLGKHPNALPPPVFAVQPTMPTKVHEEYKGSLSGTSLATDFARW